MDYSTLEILHNIRLYRVKRFVIETIVLIHILLMRVAEEFFYKIQD